MKWLVTQNQIMEPREESGESYRLPVVNTVQACTSIIHACTVARDIVSFYLSGGGNTWGGGLADELMKLAEFERSEAPEQSGFTLSLNDSEAISIVPLYDF